MWLLAGGVVMIVRVLERPLLTPIRAASGDVADGTAGAADSRRSPQGNGRRCRYVAARLGVAVRGADRRMCLTRCPLY